MATMSERRALTVSEAAEALSNAIHVSPAWQQWERARSRCNNDPTLQNAIERLQQLSRKFRVARAQGKGMLGPELAEMNRLQAEVQQSPLARERNEATQALLDFLQDANRVLSEALGVDFAASAAPRGGSCCG